MAWVDKYVSVAGAGAHDGSLGGEWTLAEAIAGAAAGNRVNIIAGTYANTTTNRTWATAGTATAPVLWEGYNTTPGDICGRVGIPASFTLAKPEITWTTGVGTSSGANQYFHGLNFSGAAAAAQFTNSTNSNKFYLCRFTNTNANSAAGAFTQTVNQTRLSRCYFSATTTAAQVVLLTNGAVIGCTARGGIIGFSITNTAELHFCISDGATTAGFKTTSTGVHFTGCIAYGAVDGFISTSASSQISIENCIAHTCSGSGITQNSGANCSAVMILGSAFYLCGTPVTGVQECATAADDLYVQQGNVTLTADPFVNAAGHDFSLSPASLARGAGIPGAFENETYVAYTAAGAVGGEVPMPPGAGRRMPTTAMIGAG